MKKVFLLLFALLLVTGCSKDAGESSQVSTFLKKDPAAAGAVAAVRDYNRVLIEVYRANDVTQIKPLVVERELNKLKHMIEGFQAQNVKMEAEIKHLQVEQAERWGPDNVVVKTKEDWHYRRVNTQTGAVVKEPTDITYRMTYRMVYWDKRWQVFNLAAD
jgi:hypothetical protein